MSGADPAADSRPAAPVPFAGLRRRLTPLFWWMSAPLPVRERGWISVCCLTLVILRAPDVVLAPRFWAEEGVDYFQHALEHGFWSALTSPQLGYYSLIPSLAGALGTLPPLEYAPVPALALALGMQLTPLLIILTHFPAGRSRAEMMALCLIAAFPPLHQEAWLNTINSQVWLTAALWLAWVSPPPAGRWRWISRLTAIAAPLTGIAACLFAPLFLWRAWRERRGEAVVQAGLVCTGALVQTAAVWRLASLRHAGASSRLEGLEPWAAAGALQVKLAAAPFLGVEVAEEYGMSIRFGGLASAELILMGALCVMLIAAMPWRGRPWRLPASLAIAVLLALTGVMGALGDKRDLLYGEAGGRYFIAANIIIAVLLTASPGPAEPPPRRLAATLLLAMWFWNGADYWLHATRLQKGPDWRREVAHWRAGEREQGIRVWPGFLDERRVRPPGPPR